MRTAMGRGRTGSDECREEEWGSVLQLAKKETYVWRHEREEGRKGDRMKSFCHLLYPLRRCNQLWRDTSIRLRAFVWALGTYRAAVVWIQTLLYWTADWYRWTRVVATAAADRCCVDVAGLLENLHQWPGSRYPLYCANVYSHKNVKYFMSRGSKHTHARASAHKPAWRFRLYHFLCQFFRHGPNFLVPFSSLLSYLLALFCES